MLTTSTSPAVLRALHKDDVEHLFIWRNHDNIRRYMYNKAKIDWDSHCQWFANIEKDDSKKVFIFEWYSIPAGFVSFSMVSRGKIADWGFYIAPTVDRSLQENKGLGKILGDTALDIAFTELDLHKIAGQVIEDNTQSITFHQRMGFTEEGRLKEHYFDGENYFDVLCFGLLKDIWLNAGNEVID
jgi:UDP-4-amino-4,6-dideoxy-N-acetyl-beta-L-altrosamine N-acetyltransferase